MTNILAELNPQQQRATTYDDGLLLILAGAGSGKTKALTYRAAYLILEKHIPAENILLLTFTNKAAGEMKERIQKLLTLTTHNSIFQPRSAQTHNLQPTTCSLYTASNAVSRRLPLAGTFHSFCAKVLRADGDLLGIPHNFVIYDETDQTEAIKEVTKRLDLSPKEYKPSSVLNTVSQAKNELISEMEYPQYATGSWQKTVSRIYLEYQKFLRQNQAVDFDDLIFRVIDLFKKFPEVLGKYQNKYRHILVDEYQDTNHAQYVLTKLLVSRYRNLTVVGDAAQSIYSWRGANYRNLVNLKSDFSDLKVINLEQNYRSTQTILEVAYSVICHNTTHPVLKLWTKNEKGEKVYLYEASSEINEAEFIVNQISRYLDKYRLSDFAILYRTNAQSRVLEEIFLHSGIPYILVGGTRFYQRKEIKDILACLRVIANPKDTISSTRIEKLGKTRLEKLLNWQESNSSKSKQLHTLDLFSELLKVTGYLELYNPKDEEDLARLENINELRSVASQFPNLNDFLENVSLVEQETLPDKPISNGNKKEAVTLMTLHASKGLEFPIIFIIGMEEGLFPHSRSLLDKNELEEERRLCYVGITRAKKKVFLTYARRRLYFGQHSANEISRFVQDIPKNLLQIANEF